MTFYITTPIYYVNSQPHIGHAYTTIVADILVRFQRLFGQEAWFLTGTDEHGEKIAEQAAKEGKSPQELVDAISEEFKLTWPNLNINYDQFIRTTDESHQAVVKEALQELYNQGYIYQADYNGLYCVGCERYLEQDDLNEEGQCPDHLTVPQEVSEKNYFFKMSLFQKDLMNYIHENPGWIYPEGYRQEVLGFLKEPLRDLCLSRPKSRLTWGIELPFDSDFVCYVWFDALLNYVSALGWKEGEAFKKFWPSAHHLMGKDVVKTHCIYWPCMLMALKIPLPKKFVVHGFWNLNALKISKSIGNVVSPLDLKEKFGADPVRYFLASSMSLGKDASFTEEIFIEKYNADLANNLGNLISRTITLTVKNFDGKLSEDIVFGSREIELQEKLTSILNEMKTSIESFELHKAAAGISEMGRQVNRYIDEHEPWKLAKSPEHRETLQRVLAIQCLSIEFIGLASFPIMPEVSQQIFAAFGTNLEEMVEVNFDWKKLKIKSKISKIAPLFPRV